MSFCVYVKNVTNNAKVAGVTLDEVFLVNDRTF